MLQQLCLKENNLGRYRGVRKEVNPDLDEILKIFVDKKGFRTESVPYVKLKGSFIVVSTRDGTICKDGDTWLWSTVMFNHHRFSHLTTYEDKSYLDYWFKL